ncbi:MAG: ABC transporter ATP-binding protein [Candidatus Izemoplasmatales bacterium]|nr:ABC transporter ATP-binding protein [Candidatus Izemoplasmatales bacterium]
MENTIDPNQAPKKSVGRSLVLMFQWMGKSWPLLITAFVFLYFISYIRTITPLFGQHIIDVILGYSNGGSKLPPFFLQFIQDPTVGKQLLLTALLIVAVEFVRAIFIFLRRTVTAVFAEKVGYRLRNNLYVQLENLGYKFHSHVETGDLIQRCTTDVESYKNFISNQIIEVVRLVLLVGLSIYQMAKLNTQLMFISLIIAPVILTIAIFYFKKVEKMFQVIEANEGKMTTHVQENVSGARVVKAFANESFEVHKFEGLNRKFTDSDYHLVKKMAIFWSGTDFICFAQFFLIAITGIVYATKGIISVGVYIAFLAYAGNIIWPMRQLGRLVGDFSKATVSVSRLDKIISTKDEYVLEVNQTEPKITGNVKFDHVGFKFDDSTYSQLEDINFAVNKGETIAIVGRTGSGKSTLMHLMVRLLDNQEGVISLDGVDVKNIEKHYLRSNIGIILQEPFLFSKTVEENIGISNRGVEINRVEEVAKIAHVHDDILHFELGYQTMVGERGVTLSGGQKQRVAIARMLLKPKPILIFDDSLSAVDTETDIQIRNALKKEWKDSTVFIITHRITTAKEADRILVLDEGKITESGSHKELLALNGLYKKIWDIQSRIDFQVEDGDI